MTTNHPAPVILDEAAVAEIEAQQVKRRESLALHQSEYPGLPSPSYIEEIDALCATVRALRRQYEGAVSDFAVEINDLREQLGQQRHAIDAATKQIVETSEQLATMQRERNEALDQCTELHQRLAQVEKERDHYKRLYEL